MPDPKAVIEKDSLDRNPNTKLGRWYVQLSDDQKSWFWELMSEAYYEGEYGMQQALELARPYLKGMPETFSFSSAKRFFHEYGPSRQKGIAS